MNEDKKTILIVEDDRALLRALSDKFTREGFNVLGAKDGLEGLKTALESQPDLILLDILMPEMGGITMLEKLRKENMWGKRVPVILLTNVIPDNDIIRKITENKPAYYLVKSDWQINDVVEKVMKCLE